MPRCRFFLAGFAAITVQLDTHWAAIAGALHGGDLVLGEDGVERID